MRNVLLSCLLAVISIDQVYAGCSQNCDAIFQEAQMEFGYYVGRYITIRKDYFEVGMFAPLSLPNSYTPFLDVHGYRFNNGRWAASAGIGLRKSLPEGSVLGFNAYYDYRRGESKHNFHQIGLGFERLNSCWDVRINGYLPILHKTQISEFCLFDQLGDGFIATRSRIEYVYSGFDAEVGASLLSPCSIHFYGAAGPYYYARAHKNHFFGGYGRLEVDWKSIFSMQVRVSYDKVNSVNAQGIFQISFPLGFFCSRSCKENWWCHHLTNQPVWRNGIILTDHCCNWTWNWDDKN